VEERALSRPISFSRKPESTLDTCHAAALRRRVEPIRLALRAGCWTFASVIPHDKLFIPGPVEVSAKTLAAFSRPMIGHRGEDFKNLYHAIHPQLQTLFGTKQPVLLSTSSAWGVMEASIRNLVDRGVLCCMCGAFSDKWLDVAKRCGKNAEPLQVDWGKHIDHKAIDQKLATGRFDTVTLIHNETSTGVMNPLPEICCILAKYPDVLLTVDTVSSFSAVKIDMDALGIDVMLTGAQKALALPPGFSLFSVSEKAFARAEKSSDRGYYFDFLEFKKQQSENMTPSTPSIGHIFALQSKLEEIFDEGLDARFDRHARTNALVHDWVRRSGFEFFAEEGFRSKTLTCVKNNRGIDVAKLVRDLRERHHLVIDGGYGKIKGQTFRLSNMGDETEETVSHLLACLDDCLG
jgi:aspartate aminotransferase-like enzyme